MSEVRSGLRHLLVNPWLHNGFQHAVGAYRWRRRVIERLVLPDLPARPRLVDIGCGTGEVVEYLPDHVDYRGFDRNDAYIDEARRRFRGRNARFENQELTPGYDAGSETVDCVLALGLLHHLDDASARALFQTARKLLRPGGFLVTLDPVYTASQSWLARYIISKDRGTEVRSEVAYVNLARECFTRIEVVADASPLLIPYTGLVMKCSG